MCEIAIIIWWGWGGACPRVARGKICACACGNKSRDIHSRTICAIYIRG